MSAPEQPVEAEADRLRAFTEFRKRMNERILAACSSRAAPHGGP